jgi:phospho-N-acetylmuramoyl-pentapeptide-transferase
VADQAVSQLGVAFAASLIVGVAAYPMLITVLVRYRARQHVASYGPASHAVKEGTPTMGGLGFVLIGVVAVLLANQKQPGLIMAFALLGGAAIGLLDDVANTRGSKKFGLSAPQKLVLQSVLGLLLGIGLAQSGFTHQLGVNLGWVLVPLVWLAVVSCANAVNLTDGVDGLAAACSAISFAALAIVGVVQNNLVAATAGAALCGALCAFLAFNWHPARVFMGDTGSLALGCGFVILTTELHVLWLLPLLGIVFVAEALSVIINVTAIRKFKKRIFRASPIHHHFEAVGVGERKLVAGFASIAAVAGLLTIAAARNGK